MTVKLKQFSDPKSGRVYIATGYVETDEDPGKDWPHHCVTADGEDSHHAHHHDAIRVLEKGLVVPEPFYVLKGD